MKFIVQNGIAFFYIFTVITPLKSVKNLTTTFLKDLIVNCFKKAFTFF